MGYDLKGVKRGKSFGVCSVSGQRSWGSNTRTGGIGWDRVMN